MGHLKIDTAQFLESLKEMTDEDWEELMGKPLFENEYPIKEPINGVIYKYVLQMQDGKFAYFNRENIDSTHFGLSHVSNFAEATTFYKEELPELNFYIKDLNKFVKDGWDIDNDTEYQWHTNGNEKGWDDPDYFVSLKIRKIKLELQ